MATVIKNIKVMLDEHQEPFIPFTTSDAVFINGTDENFTDYVGAYLALKDEEYEALKDSTEESINEMIGDLTDMENDLNEKIEQGYFTGPQGEQGVQGVQGPVGNSGVYYGPYQPTDPNVSIWVDTQDPVAIAVAEESEF